MPTEQRVSIIGRWSRFFFQAEDGIRNYKVTGVQTCALPICSTDEARLAGGAGLRGGRGGGRGGLLGQREQRGDRKSVVGGKSVDLGGRRMIKKKKAGVDLDSQQKHNQRQDCSHTGHYRPSVS